MSGYTLFDLINNVYNKRLRYPTDKELSGQIWTVNKWLSMDTDLLEVISEISKYMFCLKERYYKLLYRIVPMTGSVRNKYSKQEKVVANEVLYKYSRFFGVNLRETKQYLEILKKKYSNKELLAFIGETDGFIESDIGKKSTTRKKTTV
jgi:hypothetical protein